MDGALAWISHFMETISLVFPRIVHIHATHKGVMFTRSKAKPINPGLHLYWPVWSKPEIYPVRRQTINLTPQTLVTKDRVTVIASVTVVYEITDIEKALVETYDLQDTISDVAQIGVKQVLTVRTFDEVQIDQRAVDKSLTGCIRRQLSPYGISVRRAFLSDFAISRVFRIVGSKD